MVCFLRYVFTKRHVLKPHDLFLALCVYKAPWFVSCAFCLQSAMVCQRHIPFSRALCPHSSVLCFVLSFLFWSATLCFQVPCFLFGRHASLLAPRSLSIFWVPWIFFELPRVFFGCPLFFVLFWVLCSILECHVCSWAPRVFVSAVRIFECCAYFECHVFFSATCALRCCEYFLVPHVF